MSPRTTSLVPLAAIWLLTAPACTDDGAGESVVPQAEGEAADDGLAGIGVRVAPLNGASSENGLNLGTDGATPWPQSGLVFKADRYELTITVTPSPSRSLLLGYNPRTRELLVNRAVVPCRLEGGGPCLDATGRPVANLTTNARLGVFLKRVVVNVSGGTAEAPINVVMDYVGGAFLAGYDPASPTPGVYVEGSGVVQFGVHGSTRADALTLGARGLAINRDPILDLAWAESVVPSLAVIYGDLGNDAIFASGDAPTAVRGVGLPFPNRVILGGGPGNDKLAGGAVDDDLFGGIGSDTFVVAATEDGADDMDGGPNSDTVDYGAATGPVVVAAGAAWVPFEDDDGRIIAQRCTRPAGVAASDPKAIWQPFASPWDAAHADRIARRRADGRLKVPTCKPLEADCETEGDDVIDVERVLGGPFGDVLIGDCLTNILSGRGGADFLTPGGGVGGAGDVMNGDGDGDTLHAGYFANGPTAFFGGAGSDTLTYADRPHRVRMVSQRTRAGVPGQSGASDDVTVAFAANSEGDSFGADAEILIATGGADYIIGSAGANRIYARDGNDFVNGDRGNDRIFGEEGNDTLRGGVGSDALVGGFGADAIWGDVGADLIDGDRGRFCADAPTTPCLTNADCAGGACIFDRFCPPEAISCDDLIFGGTGLDRIRAALDRGSDAVFCNNERSEDLRNLTRDLRKTKDNVVYTDTEGAVTVDWDADMDDGQEGLADLAGYGGDRDYVDDSCEVAPAPTPRDPGAWTVEVAPPAAGAGEPYRVGEPVTIALSNANRVVRTDVIFASTRVSGTGADGTFRAPSVVTNGETPVLRVFFLAPDVGRHTVSVALGGTVFHTTAELEFAAPSCDAGCDDGTHCALLEPSAGLCVADSCFDNVRGARELRQRARRAREGRRLRWGLRVDRDLCRTDLHRRCAQRRRDRHRLRRAPVRLL